MSKEIYKSARDAVNALMQEEEIRTLTEAATSPMELYKALEPIITPRLANYTVGQLTQIYKADETPSVFKALVQKITQDISDMQLSYSKLATISIVSLIWQQAEDAHNETLIGEESVNHEGIYP